MYDDHRNLCTWKKLPDAQLAEYVYDNGGRLTHLVLALVLGVSVSVFAAGAPKSQEQRLVPINGEVAPGDYVGWTEDKDGNFIDYVNPARSAAAHSIIREGEFYEKSDCKSDRSCSQKRFLHHLKLCIC